MINIYGILTILFSSIGYFFATRYYHKGKEAFSVLFLLMSGLCLRLWTASDPWLHPWDERYHALVGKNLQKHLLIPTLFDNALLPYNYREWDSNHIWLHKQPLTLWLIALSLKLLGTTALAVRIPSIVLSTISIKLVFDIAKKWISKEVALLSAFLLSIHGLMIELTAGLDATDHVDICFLFFILLAIWLSIIAFEHNKEYIHILAGIALGCAILTKWLPALIVLAIWLLMANKKYNDHLQKRWLSFLLVLVSAALIAIPWQVYIFSHFPLEAHWEYSYNAQHFTENLENHSGNFFYHFEHLRFIYGEAIYLPVAWFTYYTFKIRNPVYYIIALWFWLPYLFFSIAATKMQAYTLIAAPAIFMITAIFFFRCIVWAKEYNKYKYAFYIIAASLIILPIRYAIERIKPLDNKAEDISLYNEVQNCKQKMKHPEQTIVFNCPYYVEVMFYTNCKAAYNFIPDANLQNKLKLEGFDIVMYGQY